MSTNQLYIGCKVKNLISGSIGEVMLVTAPGASDCAVVRFHSRRHDGICVPRRNLVLVEEKKATEAMIVFAVYAFTRVDGNISQYGMELCATLEVAARVAKEFAAEIVEMDEIDNEFSNVMAGEVDYLIDYLPNFKVAGAMMAYTGDAEIVVLEMEVTS